MIGLLGLSGITVLESSGGIGAGPACMSNHGSNTTEFEPPGSQKKSTHTLSLRHPGCLSGSRVERWLDFRLRSNLQQHNTIQPPSGTSTTAPVVAGILALLSGARFRVGKGPLGFNNPWHYSIGWTAHNEITNGTAVGCNGINGQTGRPVSGGGVIPYATWNAMLG
ncbi:hypothetical protein BGZ57DRAFT_856401 [Hyaloscypha finlandica]|nr:hypothetical protein BGZ57DRAFT_856401 [Hyaloscypha finlandica]